MGEGAQRPPVGEAEGPAVEVAQVQPRRTTQLRTAPAISAASASACALPLLLELRQLLLHRRPQALGGAAQVDSQERVERVTELVRYDAHLVVAQRSRSRHVAAAAAASASAVGRGAIDRGARARGR